MPDSLSQELLQLNQRLLDSIAEKDWAAYQELCDPSLTAFEPESLGQLVEGMDFHHFYFQLGGGSKNRHTTMCSPQVRILGDVALVCYIRLNQGVDASGLPATTGQAETRVWQRQNGRWKHVHFHRSALQR